MFWKKQGFFSCILRIRQDTACYAKLPSTSLKKAFKSDQIEMSNKDVLIFKRSHLFSLHYQSLDKITSHFRVYTDASYARNDLLFFWLKHICYAALWEMFPMFWNIQKIYCYLTVRSIMSLKLRAFMNNLDAVVITRDVGMCGDIMLPFLWLRTQNRCLIHLLK